MVTLPSAEALKVKLRIVLAAPKKEGLVLVFELPKVTSVEVLKVGVVPSPQFAAAPQFPSEEPPVQVKLVCARA
jgi:hypothetical protein